MRISVVIPTHNRAEILRKTLRGYAGQSALKEVLEVIVVDNGSTDDTTLVALDCCRCFALPLRYIRLADSGLSVARNRAIQEAQGEIILFGDDDIIPGPELVAQHIAWHQRDPEPNVGVLGCVTWAPEVRATPFMVWAGLYGPQFRYGYFKPGMEVEFQNAYFCNTSLKTSFLRAGGAFNEVFCKYGWEDIELSYRLCKKGYRLLYNPDALGYHYKYERFDNTLGRAEAAFTSWPTFAATDAGKCFAEIVHRRLDHSSARSGILRTSLARSIKACAMPVLKRLLDTQIPLPAWVYERVLYHYLIQTIAYREFLEFVISPGQTSSALPPIPGGQFGDSGGDTAKLEGER